MQLLPDLTNTEVVARLRAGDEAVFTRLYQSTYRMVYLQAMKILGQADQAELVVQDVYITVFRSIQNLKEPETLRSWIGGIAVHLALKRRQKLTNSREFAVEEEAMLDLLDSGQSVQSPEEVLCERDTGAILGELVDELPDEQRTAVMLYYYDQCPIKQIASIMECAEGTIKSRLNYARKAMEKLILKREQREGVRLHARIVPSPAVSSARDRSRFFSKEHPTRLRKPNEGKQQHDRDGGFALASRAGTTCFQDEQASEHGGPPLRPCN